MVSKERKDVGQDDKAVRGDVANGQIALYHLQSGKIRERSNRSREGEVARNSRKGRCIARHTTIDIDVEIAARIRGRRARGVPDLRKCITSCGIASEGGATSGRNGAIGDARQTATRRKAWHYHKYKALPQFS